MMNDYSPAQSRKDLDDGQRFTVLSSARRRNVLRIVRDESSMHLSEIATRVAWWERESEDDATSVERIHADLYHCQVPKLVDVGLVEYVTEHDEITLADPDGLTARLIAAE